MRAANAVDCITEPALEHAIIQRMGRDPFAGPPRQWIEAIVEFEGGYYSVQLFERDGAGKTLGRRELHEAAGDCHQLDDAIVLAIALIIDPTADFASSSPPGAPPALRANPAISDAMPPLAPVAQPSTPRAAVVPTPAPVAARAVTPPSAAFVTASAVGVYGVLPGLAPGVELVTALPVGETRRQALRFSALYLPEKRDHEPLGDIGYGLTALEAGACSSGPEARVRWFGCVALGLGAIHAVVHDPVPLEPGDRFWAAFRFEGGVGIHLGGPVWLESRVFALLAPRRWDFRVNTAHGSESAFKQAPLMPGMALGLALHFN